MTSCFRISSRTVLKRRNWRRSKKDCMSSMISETSWLPLPSSSAISPRTFHDPVPTCWPPTPKVSPSWSLIRPPILYWSREAALSRLTSVLPSRLARTRFSSSAIFSNSASRSRCLLHGLLELLLGGAPAWRRILGLAHDGRHRQPLRRRARPWLGGAACRRAACRAASSATTPCRRSGGCPARPSTPALLLPRSACRRRWPGSGRPSAAGPTSGGALASVAAPGRPA